MGWIHLTVALFVASYGPVARAEGPFQPLPKAAPVNKDNPQTPDKIRLGKQLFFDPRLSLTGTLSCNSCHNVMADGSDGRPTSLGVHAQAGGRNSPTVWNSAFMTVQFWDGRAPTLEEQAKGPMVNSVEMGMGTHDVVLGRIRKIPGYVTQFKKVFGNNDSALTIDNAVKAIAAYERTLITPGSAFDKFLKGDKKAISAAAQKGHDLVISTGCITCHMGVNFAGPALPIGMGFFQKFPVYPESEYVAKYTLTKDPGRFEATKKEEDKGMWRVPTWRNVALTAPYFHNGSVATLEEAVRVMASTQLNKKLNDDEVANIVAFLETLSGPFPEQSFPRLPETSGKTVISD
jgi:cytochrome c peroxidase